MKTETRPEYPLNEQTIREAAREAVIALELDAEVKSVSAEKGRWCVSFTADYRQFSDTFVDRFGKENSFELVREKIKRHILKQQQNKIRSSVRIRRGQEKRPTEGESLFETAVQTIETVASQAAEVTGAIINQAVSLPAQALTALTATDESVSPTTEPPISPELPSQPLARVTVRAAGSDSTSRPVRSSSKRKASSTSKRKASSKTRTTAAKKRTAAAQKRRPLSAATRPASAAKKSRAVSKVKPKAATKKKATKKKKSAARKATPRPAQKRGATKRGAKGKR